MFTDAKREGRGIAWKLKLLFFHSYVVFFTVFDDLSAAMKLYGLLTKCEAKMVNKGFIIWLSWKFFLQDTAGRPARVANHSAGFDSSYQLTELAI